MANDYGLQRHLDMAAERRTLPVQVFEATYVSLPRGGTRRELTLKNDGEFARIEPPGGATQQVVGGAQTSVAEFDVHLRPDLTVPDGWVVRVVGGDDFEILGDKSHPSHRAETVLSARRFK